MTRQIFASALFAGLAAGLVAAVLTLWLVTPVILEGERYEIAAMAGGTHGHAAEAAGGLARHALTFFMDLVTYTGFALVLAACFALAARAGLRIDRRQGLLWGIAGFAAVQLAPALGLPPELPGTPAADLTLRQIWWTATVAGTAGGLALVFLGRGLAVLAGLALILAPHLVGAPTLASPGGAAPPELAALIVARALATGAIAWAVLGAAAGWFWTRTGAAA